jgi:hypothetical protein
MSQNGRLEQQTHTTGESLEQDSSFQGTPLRNPEVNQEVLKALFDIAEIIEKHDEEEPSERDREAMADVCGKIRAAIIDRFPVCKDLVPKPAPYAMGIACHSLVSIGLGVIPQQVHSPILKFLDDSDEGRFPRLSSLQSIPLNVRDIAGTLERNSPLEWFSMHSQVQGPSMQVSQRDFLRQLLRIARLATDDTGRHEEAVRWIERTHETLATIQEIGENFPVQLYSEQPRNSAGLDVIDTPASYFGHNLQAYFSNEIKRWLLFRLDGKPLAIPGDTASKVQLRAGKGPVHDCSGYAFDSAGDLAKAVRKLQSGSDISFIPVHSRRPPYVAGLLPAYFGNGREHDFWGARTKDPIVLRGVQEREIILNSLEPDSRPAEKVLQWKMVETAGEPAGRGIRFAVSVSGSQVSVATLKDLMEPRGYDRTLKVRVLQFDDLHTLLLFERPLPLRRPEDLWQLAYNHKGKKAQLYGFQAFSGDGLLHPIFKDPELAISGKQFGSRKLVLNYSSAGTLTVGRPINRLPMGFSYLSALELPDFPKDAAGHNVLTNQWDLCIPLHKPPVNRFKHPLLRPIEPLQAVSAQDWPLLVQSLEGDWVSSIADIADTLRSRESSPRAESLTSPGLSSGPKPGEFYKAPRESVDICAPWIISNCELNGQKYYVVDSPLYGDALYLYRYKEGAKLAAEHLARHGRRSAVREFPGFLQRIIHRDGWRRRLTEAVYEHILGKELPPHARELGA